jgi:hypothetical protein
MLSWFSFGGGGSRSVYPPVFALFFPHSSMRERAIIKEPLIDDATRGKHAGFKINMAAVSKFSDILGHLPNCIGCIVQT